MSVQPATSSSSIGSHSSRRITVSVAVMFSWIRANKLAALAAASVTAMDSDTDGLTDSFAKVASATDAASLVEAGNTVFAEGVSVLALVSETEAK